MRKTVLAALPLTLLALALPATAQARGKATSYKAAITPLAAPSDGATASKHGARRQKRGRHGAGRAAGVRGQARLTDGARRDRVRLTVRGLARGERYTWSLRSAAAGEDACAGDVVDAFSYRALRRGRPHASARSRDFAVAEGTAYAVVVTGADGVDVACGTFGGKAAGGGKHGGKGHDQASDDDAGDDSAGDEDGSGDDDPAGDDDSAGDDDPAGDDDSLQDDDPSADDTDEDSGDDDEDF